jgi:IQ domain-containing protein H
VGDIKSAPQFYKELTRLISQNLYVNTWLFKIDTEYGGRGHAWLPVD